MLPEMIRYVKSFDQTKCVFFIEDHEFSKKYNEIWDNISKII